MTRRPHSLPRSKEPLPGERAVDTELLAATLAELNRQYGARGPDTARQLGELLLGAFFGGEPTRFRERSRKHASFRALCHHPELQPTYSFLWYAVAVAEQYRQLPADVAEALPLSHHRLLLPIHDQATKLRLARKARDGQLSKRRLEELVRKERKRQPSEAPRGGRPPLPAFVKGLSRLKAAVDLAVADEITETTFARYPPEDAKKLLSQLYGQMEQLSNLAEHLRECLTRLDEPDAGGEAAGDAAQRDKAHAAK